MIEPQNRLMNLLMQWTAAVSSSLFRQTLQNRRLWCVGSDQQCATGFFIKHGATPEHGVTTFVTHFSWTIKLQTIEERKHFINNYKGNKFPISQVLSKLKHLLWCMTSTKAACISRCDLRVVTVTFYTHLQNTFYYTTAANVEQRKNVFYP